MLTYVVLIVVLFVVFVTILFVLRLNRQQVAKVLYYQYNYIPKPFISFVKVYALKNHL
ncbi:ORF110 [Leucania separata nucleopolyhedrovirus]|uniref:ORF110 n=1 Tax=Leucania separata nucleopolyhedrovirus TaxID=1307956 RepID=O55575_NPVLS|nr:ORF110 [Leucania separata nucleopolyhedrovirus]AAR28874.1 ORF110 [Leucania separata nucleopolyhedrovirus]BAA24251.1 ORF110 [Leucania separata nucleopolyhedrovirus]